jgi:hypothetical protein
MTAIKLKGIGKGQHPKTRKIRSDVMARKYMTHDETVAAGVKAAETRRLNKVVVTLPKLGARP